MRVEVKYRKGKIKKKQNPPRKTVITFCISKLILSDVYKINGIPIRACEHAKLREVYKSVFGSDLDNDYNELGGELAHITKSERKEERRRRIENVNKERMAQFICQLIENATKPELMFKDKLDAAGINYEFQKGLFTESSFYIADFYIPDIKLIVEIDGGYHLTKEQKKKDKTKDKFYRSLGLKVLRIQNNHVKRYDVSRLTKQS